MICNEGSHGMLHTWLLLSRWLRYNWLGWWLWQLVLQVPKLLLILQVQWGLQILSHPQYILTHVYQGVLQYPTRRSLLANILKHMFSQHNWSSFYFWHSLVCFHRKQASSCCTHGMHESLHLYSAKSITRGIPMSLNSSDIKQLKIYKYAVILPTVYYHLYRNFPIISILIPVGVFVLMFSTIH